jgi:hypothetical protein
VAEPWWAPIERQSGQDGDAEHWISVYGDLIEILIELAQHDPSIERRIEEMRARRRYWEARRSSRRAVRR